MQIPSPKRLWRRVRSSSGHADDPVRRSDEALEQADRLVADGRLVDAIRVLTDLNREQRDPEIERRLIDLRFEAFAAQAHPVAPPPWPSSVDDLFPGELVPEVDRSDLTAESLRSGIANHGSILVRGLLDQQQVARLRDAIDRSIDAFDAVDADSPRPDLDGWFEQSDRCPEADRQWKRRAGAVLAIDSPRGLFELLEVFGDAGITRLTEGYFGEAPTLLGLKTTLRKVSHVAWRHGDWHQDGSFMGTAIRSLNVWVALTHCGDDAPGLDIVGRRFDGLAQTGTDGASARWSVGTAVAEREAGDAVVRPVFEPGDALLFDHLMLHRTAIEPEMVNDRYAVEVWFFAPSTYDIMTSTDEQPNPPSDQRPFWL
ncbi:MAG: hypothetical protein ACXWCM_04405 [Acidimicrobiales bacterium]